MKPIQIEGVISDRDILVAVISNIIGIITLTFPRILAAETSAADGWLTILLGGAIVSLIAWILAKVTSAFPNQSFFSFSSYLVTKPIAVLITILFTLQYIAVSSFQIRQISVLAHQYLFDQTPDEVIALVFLLVVVYAISGSRAGIFRLNIIFFPFMISGLFILILLPLGFIHTDYLLPVFQTDFHGYLTATYSSINIFMGFGIILFYIALVKKPRSTPKRTVIGIGLTMIISLFIYIICIGTFGNAATSNLFFPTFDLSRTVEIPGGFFERFDSLLFVIWTMVMFSSCMMAFDIVVMTISMIFTKFKKVNVILTLSPIIFFTSMLPKDYTELIAYGNYISFFIFMNTLIVTIILGIAYKIKGANQNE